MIEGIIKKLNVQVTHTDEEYIRISDTRKARGAFRWDYQKHRGEILLAKSATERTKLHELGHTINFILGNGQKYSDRMGIDSEEFANMVADILELCYNKTMIEQIKKLFIRDRSVEIQLIEVIKRQQEFIAQNINERVVYVDPQSGYTNVERFDSKEEPEEEEDFEEPQDLSPEDLRIQMEGKKEEGSK